MPLNIETVDINSILENPANCRIHSEEQILQLAASFKEFSQQIPLVVSRKDRIVIVGNGRLRALRDVLKWRTVDVVWSDLSPEQAAKFGIADNAHGANSEWDLNMLGSSVQEIYDLDPHFDWNAIGFTNDEVIPMLSNLTDEDLMFLNGGESKPKKEELPDAGKSIKVTKEQRELIDQAILKLRSEENDPKLSEGRCVELITAEYLSST